MDIVRKTVDWVKTGKRLENLRRRNIHLRRIACKVKGNCENLSRDCSNCIDEIDSAISREELAVVFNVSESVIFNWESGRTPIGVEDLLFYMEIAKVSLDDILVLSNKRSI